MTSPIRNFYKNKSVFITGGTGFLGKVIIEKLLYSCRDLNSIFMHIKPKHGKNIDDRMNELFALPIFERLQKENPKALRKVIPIAGNLRDEGLGISSKDMSTLHNEVSVVFHSAAAIKFDYDLKPCFEVNTRGTQKLLKICKGIKNLKSLVFVSTAFSNCPVKIIEEDVYETGISIDYVKNFLKTANIEDCKKLIGARPNAYTLSKALAEELLAKEAQAFDLPISIVRPSFITSIIKEPLPGYTENWYGWNSVIIGGSNRALRIMLGYPDIVPGIIPVDYVSNLCITAAWDSHRRREHGDKKLKVFNCCSGMRNGIRHDDICRKIIHNINNTVKYVGPKPEFYIFTNRRMYNIAVYFAETIPNYGFQLWELISGKKSKFLKMYNITRTIIELCSDFTLNEYKFVDTNTTQLFRDLSEEDAKNFYFNVKNINWDVCLKDYVDGVHKYVMRKT